MSNCRTIFGKVQFYRITIQTPSLLTLSNAQPCSHIKDIYNSFYITTPHPLSIYTVTQYLPFTVSFFYIWNVTFKLLAKELFGLLPVQCTNFIQY